MSKRIIYQAIVVAAWLGGLFSCLSLIGVFARGETTVGSGFAPVIAIALLAGNGMALYSFFLGAQAGHYARAVNVMLVALLCYSTYRDYAAHAHANLAFSAISWAIAITIVIVNRNWAQRFRDQYRREGKVDYFKRYFS